MSIKKIQHHVLSTLKTSGEIVKSYTYDEKNIAHLSLIIYDLMPLSVKLAIRYEKFAEKFKVMFISLRNHLYQDIQEKAPTTIKRKRKPNAPATKKTVSRNKKPSLRKTSD